MSTIAILDDRVTNRHIYMRLATAVEPGIEVKAYASPLQALDSMRDNPPDLVITDYKMPDMDGAAFVARFRQLPGCADVPIIVVTVYEDREFRLHALDAGATDFLQSPVDHHEFMTRARNLLKLRKQQKIIESRAHDLERELISAERSREKVLRDSREMLAQVIDTVPALVSAADRDGRFVFVNAYQATLMGKTQQDIVGCLMTEIYDREIGAHGAMLDKMVFASGDPIAAYEEEFADCNGVMRAYLTSKAPLRDSSGNVINVLTSSVEITARKHAEKHLLHAAYHDALTGLPNRAWLRDRLHRIIGQARIAGITLAVHLINIDRFKGLNDALGYAMGDEFIKLLAARLGDDVAPPHELAHLGGDEFVVVQANPEDAQDAAAFAENLLRLLRQPLAICGHEVNPAGSIGTAMVMRDGDDPDELIRNANLAMTEAKIEGGDTHRFFAAGMNHVAMDAMALDFDLRRALARNEFELHYQPQVSLQSGRIVAVEALLRWRRPGEGLVGPDRFLTFAEECGLIIPISEWVLHEAARQAMEWRGRGLPPLRMAVNLSPLQFRRRDVGTLVRDVLRTSGLEPGFLELELTENTAMKNPEAVAAEITALRALGVHFSLDDFGTGYSSLSYIKNLPVGRLKIDRSFIANVASDENDAAIVRTIIALARALRIAVIAEGVETAEQADYLREQGCDEVQGYLFSRPLPAKDCAALLSLQSPSSRIEDEGMAASGERRRVGR